MLQLYHSSGLYTSRNTYLFLFCVLTVFTIKRSASYTEHSQHEDIDELIIKFSYTGFCCSSKIRWNLERSKSAFSLFCSGIMPKDTKDVLILS